MEVEIMPGRRLTGRVVAVLTTPDPKNSFETTPVDSLTLTMEGIPGERHFGHTRKADARTPWFPRGTPIRNTRQVSLLAPGEMAEMAKALDLTEMRPEWLGGNIVVEGIPGFSFLPRGTRLFFPGAAVIAVEMQNAPCRFSGAAVQEKSGAGPGLDLRFAAAVKRMRGLVGFVERPGSVKAGDTVKVVVPEQWTYAPDRLL